MIAKKATNPNNYETVLRDGIMKKSQPLQSKFIQGFGTAMKTGAHQDESNDTPQPMGEFYISFSLLRIKINQDKPYSTVKRS